MALANITNNILTDSGILVTNLTPTSRTITINGVTYDLSADRSWTIATGVTGTGTTNYLPKFTGTSTIGNSNLINDASGNLGLGVTPSAFGYAGNMQIVDGGILGSIGTYIHNVTNAYYDTSWKYRQSASSARYSQEVGSHVWYNAPSGTAGNAITFTQAMTLNASGNLGIGTTNPTSRLDVVSTSTSTAALVVRGGSSIGSASAASGQILVGQTATYRLSLSYDDNTGYAYIDNLYDNANSNIYFRVRTNGTPINALTLFGTGAATFSNDILARSGTIDSRAYKIYEASAGRGGLYPYNLVAGTGTDYSVGLFSEGELFLASGGSITKRLVINNSGNVGIGTTAPSEKLHVAGNIKVTIGDIDVDSSTSYIRANNTRIAGTDRKIQVWNNVSAYIDVLTMAATGAATFSSSVTAGGKGIFETNTTVGNDGTYTGYASVGLGGTTNGFNRVFGGVGTNDGLFLASATGRGIYFRAGGGTTDQVSITSGGTLLVGTTTEGFLGKLQVAGSVAITGQYNTVLPSSSFSYFDGSGQVVSSSSSASALYLDTTWNTTGNPDGIYLNVTNTASGASSKLLNLKVGSVSQFSVSKAGAIQTSAPSVGSAHAWKLGSYAAGGTGTATGVIYIEVNGQIYSIPALLGTP